MKSTFIFFLHAYLFANILQIVQRGIMVRTAVQNVVQTVSWPMNVTGLQENVMEGVIKDGQEIHVIRVNNILN